jgi:L,D-transpeptidase ErfK/SrfK
VSSQFDGRAPLRLRNKGLGIALLAAGWALAGRCGAAEMPLPTDGDLIGDYAEVTAVRSDTLSDLAHRYGLGYEEVVNANPGVDPWLPGEGTVVRLPLRRVLPDTPHEGIVVNLPEHRLYYYPPAKAGEARVVITYPVSVGKMDWSTPIGLTHVAAKIKDPAWYPPESVRTEHAARGDILPRVVPAGPDNPLGQFAMRLAIPGGGYMIHGTNNPAGVGMQVTHGCMRLYPEDIEALFKRVAVDTPVRIVNQPQKVGWQDGQLYVEVHPPLEATESGVFEPDRTALARLITHAVRSREDAGGVTWARAEVAFEEARGIPLPVTGAATPARTLSAAR